MRVVTDAVDGLGGGDSEPSLSGLAENEGEEGGGHEIHGFAARGGLSVDAAGAVVVVADSAPATLGEILTGRADGAVNSSVPETSLADLDAGCGGSKENLQFGDFAADKLAAGASLELCFAAHSAARRLASSRCSRLSLVEVAVVVVADGAAAALGEILPGEDDVAVDCSISETLWVGLGAGRGRAEYLRCGDFTVEELREGLVPEAAAFFAAHSAAARREFSRRC